MSTRQASARTSQTHRDLKVAVIQLRARIGAVEENLLQLDSLVREAVREHEPALVVLPESVATPLVHDPRIATTVRPVDGAPMQLYRQLARELGVVISGGFLAQRGHDVHSTYLVAEPDGAVHLRNHESYGFWSRHYSRGKSSLKPALVDGLAGAPVGMACGWEWARTQTARQLRYRVQLLVGGMCWSSFPLNWAAPVSGWMRREHARHLWQARELPSQVARLVGTPVAIAGQVGAASFGTPGLSTLPWRTELIGQSRIVDRDGTVLASLGPSDGDGHASATIRLGPPEPLDALPEHPWIPSLSHTTRLARRTTRTHGAASYHVRKLVRRQSWQNWPSADLPDEIGPGQPGEQPVATSGPAAARRA